MVTGLWYTQGEKLKRQEKLTVYANKLSLAKIGSEKLSSKIWLRFVLLRRAYQLGLAQRSSAFKLNHYSVLFYSEKIRSKFWLSILILKVQRTSISFKSSFGALDDAEGSWLGFDILIFNLDMVTGLWYTHNLNIGSLSWFWKCQEYPCPLSPHLGLERTRDVRDWGLGSWSWFG